MTEAEWLACDDPQTMLTFTIGRTNERKRWLFACACCHRVALPLSYPEKVRRFIETVEQFVDGEVSFTDVGNSELEAWEHESLKWRNTHDPIWLSVSAVSALWPTLKLEEAVRYGCEVAAYEALVQAAELSSQRRSYRWWKREPKLTEKEIQGAESKGAIAEQRVYCDRLRDIFGNLFRPIVLASSWLTFDVRALAEGIYQDRAFDRMPILADALQDAGCDNEGVLNHCRQPGEHVRGCWVVDLLTGRE